MSYVTFDAIKIGIASPEMQALLFSEDAPAKAGTPTATPAA